MLAISMDRPLNHTLPYPRLDRPRDPSGMTWGEAYDPRRGRPAPTSPNLADFSGPGRCPCLPRTQPRRVEESSLLDSKIDYEVIPSENLID